LKREGSGIRDKPIRKGSAAATRRTRASMLSIYAKNEQSDMTAADRKAAKKFVEGLKDAKKQAGK
jgi:3'-phosphoadenosine 5'-phosphosulfate (PAPS) 3'-phosphatase